MNEYNIIIRDDCGIAAGCNHASYDEVCLLVLYLCDEKKTIEVSPS